MAEQVQATMDRMVPALQDWQDRALFSLEEIHATVNRRRTSEYLLRRRVARKSDFLAYLQAERSLEELRALRTQRADAQARRQAHEKGVRKNADDNDETKKRLGDSHVKQHLHLLWTRTLRKFRGDKSLYLQYAAFCKETYATKRLGRLYAEAVQVFPKEAGFWIESASHEYFEAGSVATARVLLQRGLRILPYSQDLWLQYFTLELHFCTKLLGRKAVLQQADAKEEEGADSDAIIASDDSDKKDNDPFFIPRLVYDNCVASFQKQKQAAVVMDDEQLAAMQLQFLQVCQGFPLTESLQEVIRKTLPRRSVAAWMAKVLQQEQETARDDDDAMPPPAKRLKADPSSKDNHNTVDGDASEKENAVVAILREATQALPTHDMYLAAVQYLRAQYAFDDNDSEQSDKDSSSSSLQEGKTLLESLFEKAAATMTQLQSSGDDNKTGMMYSISLALEHVDYLERLDEFAKAIKVLQECVPVHGQDARLWMAWARLLVEHNKEEESSAALGAAQAILKRGLSLVSMTLPDHLLLLLQLLGLQLLKRSSSDNDDKGQGKDSELEETFASITLLAPGFLLDHSSQNAASVVRQDDPVFGIENVADACRQYLEFAVEHDWDIGRIRKIYEVVLFTSTLSRALENTDALSIEVVCDLALAAEEGLKDEKMRMQRCRRLCETAVELFQDTAVADKYRIRLSESRFGSADSSGRHASANFKIPTFDMAVARTNPDRVMEAYRRSRVVLLRNAAKVTNSFSWKAVGPLFEKLDKEDQSSWCVETSESDELSSSTFLQPKILRDSRAYCSFLVQKDVPRFEETVGKIPLNMLGWDKDWSYEPALWFFFGRNTLGEKDLHGRSEHTDSVSHDGTWHYQLSGSKHWFVRPTNELRSDLGDDAFDIDATQNGIKIVCEKGDVLLINTRLWFHRTVIPAQTYPSVSYARDVRFQPSAHKVPSPGDMTNVDGLYATETIEEGTIIFTEADMPKCELHRSAQDPTCEIVEAEDGLMAVVARRRITTGEFFCVAESSSEEEGSKSGIVSDAESE